MGDKSSGKLEGIISTVKPWNIMTVNTSLKECERLFGFRRWDER
jgi:hypothetical protein